MTKNYTLDSEPTGATYRSLIRVAPRWCSKALFVVRKRLGLSEPGAALTRRLEPFLIERSNLSSWPGTVLLDGSASVSVFHLEPRVVEILSMATNRLFGWQQPALPEDLCLLREGGDPWLVTIAHEGDGYLALEPGELEQLRRDLPDFAGFLREKAQGNP